MSAGRVDRSGSRRVGDFSALSAFAPSVLMLPFCVVALFVLWLPVGAVSGVRFPYVLLGFAALGLLLWVKPFQVAVLTPLLGARAPTERERTSIEPVWAELAAANGLSPTRYVVRIVPSDALNAYACGGHLVLVTSYAVDELTTPELRGVLAHELSHHLGFHTVATTLTHWLSAPVVILARIGLFVENVAIAAARSFGRGSRAVELAGLAIARRIHAVAWVFTAGLRAGDALGNMVGHRSEFDADQRAVRMGYGRDLARALRRVIASHGSVRPVGWRERLEASHPPARTRVARVAALLRHPARPDGTVTSGRPGCPPRRPRSRRSPPRGPPERATRRTPGVHPTRTRRRRGRRSRRRSSGAPFAGRSG